MTDEEEFMLGADRLWLIAARNVDRIRELEQKLGQTQAEVVNVFIEETRWAAELPAYAGYRGRPEERLKALRKVIGQLPENEYALAMREPN